MAVSTCVVEWIERVVPIWLSLTWSVSTCVVEWIESYFSGFSHRSNSVSTCVVEWIESIGCISVIGSIG